MIKYYIIRLKMKYHYYVTSNMKRWHELYNELERLKNNDWTMETDT